MQKKGFTLIELLAVIVILAIIALIAVPVIMNIISSARKSAFEDTAYGLVSAGEMYYASELLNGGMLEDTEFAIENGAFKDKKLEVKGSLPGSGKVKVTTDGKVALAITNGSICIKKGYDDSDIETLEEFDICELPAGAPTVKTLKDLAKTNDFIATVDACATSGDCAVGTKFALEVAPGEIKNFYVIRDVDNKVTLLMDRNVDETTVAWINKADYLGAGGTEAEWNVENADWGNHNKGPITVLTYLESQTSGWTNIEAKDYTLTDNGYGTITRTNARARMLTETEANAIIDYDWSYANLDGVDGYWTSSTWSGYDSLVFTLFRGSLVDGTVASDGYYGVRPVIEITK